MPPTSLWRNWIWPVLVGTLLAIGLGLWIGRDQSIQVQIEVATHSDVTRLLAVNGKVAPLHSVQIRSAVSGRVMDVMAQEGALVSRGAVMAQLDAAAQMANVVQAQTALTQARARAAQATSLHERDILLRGNITANALEAGRLAMVSAAQDVLRLEAALSLAGLMLKHYTITAPFAGLIMFAPIEFGQLVEPSTLLFSLADTTSLVVEAVVDETYASQLAAGQTANLQVIGARAVLAGQVASVAPRVDVATGGIAIKIAFDAPPTAAVGQTVTANVVIDTRRALTVPRSALQGEAVFVMQAGTARLTPLTTIDWPAERLIVTQGLTEGDLVIITAAGLVDGAAVKAN
jgi:RND family efflux transporter MFP subunit